MGFGLHQQANLAPPCLSQMFHMLSHPALTSDQPSSAQPSSAGVETTAKKGPHKFDLSKNKAESTNHSEADLSDSDSFVSDLSDME